MRDASNVFDGSLVAAIVHLSLERIHPVLASFGAEVVCFAHFSFNRPVLNLLCILEVRRRCLCAIPPISYRLVDRKMAILQLGTACFCQCRVCRTGQVRRAKRIAFFCFVKCKSLLRGLAV